MDGRRRAYDKIFVERLWWTLKYEEVYLHDYQTIVDAMRVMWYYICISNDL